MQNKGKCAFKITSLGARDSAHLCGASIALRALLTAAQASPGKSFFWADVGFCHGTYALTEVLWLLARALQNSQQAISAPRPPVARQEIPATLAKSQFPLGAWFAVFVSVSVKCTSPFSVRPSRILGVDARKRWSSEQGGSGPLRVTIVPGVCQLSPELFCTVTAGDGLGLRKDIGDRGLHQPEHGQWPWMSDRDQKTHGTALWKRGRSLSSPR